MPTIEEIKAWQGDTVTDREGEKIGSIDEIYVDRDSGEPEWLAVKTGLFGNKLSFVPVAEAARTGDEVRVPYEKAQVKDAPQVDSDGELSEAEKTDLYRHYGLEQHAQPREVTDEVRKAQIEAVRDASQR
jgi:sporulation protein YlmC with PRC-barrel domain